MLDLRYVREHREEVIENVRHRKSVADVDKILALDDERIALAQKIDLQRQELNASSKEKPSSERIAQLRLLGTEIKAQEAALTDVAESLSQAAAYLPNMSSPEMPLGAGEADNVELAVWLPDHGYIATGQLGTNDTLAYRPLLPQSTFESDSAIVRRHHLDVGESLGIIDMPQGAKVAGSRFAYLMGDAMLLQNAIIQLLSQKLLASDFTWIDPPLLVRERVLFGTSHFPEGRDQVYQISQEHLEDRQSLYLVGSSEPSLFAYGMDRTFTQDELPLKMFAVTPCFRSEVGSWGRDVRGIKRVHQFTKLEMDVICTPMQSDAIFEALRGYNEWFLQELGLPYRVIRKCTGDCGYLATYQQYDLEVWMPSQSAFMETMTDTHATDFQARRLNIRVLDADGSRILAHTVNDTGVAIGRMIAAILDNYQQPDGTVIVPEALRPWIGRDVLVPHQQTASIIRNS